MDAALEERLGEIQAVHEETLQQLADPDVLADQDRYTEIARRHAELKPVVDAYQAYLEAATERDDALELAGLEDDDEMAAYLRRVAEEKGAEIEKLELELRRLLVPRDPNDQKDVIMEVRSAAGGEEAALWAGDLYRMYQRYAERHGWTVEPMDTSWAEGGGLKEATFAVKGRGAYSRLKFEAGPHRVQRVPSRSRREGSTRRSPRWPCFPRSRTSRSSSATPTWRSTCSGPGARAGSRSTPPTRRCGSPTCPPGWS